MKWFGKIRTKLKGKEAPEVEEYKLKDNEMKKLSESFVSRDEKYIASLGNGYIMNYLANKSVKKGFAFITDKRVYFKGSCLSGTGKKLVKTNEERTVDVKNITGSGFTYHRYWGILIALFISIILSIGGAIGGVVLSHEYIDIDIDLENVDMRGSITSFKERTYWKTLLKKIDNLQWYNDDHEYYDVHHMWMANDGKIKYTISLKNNEIGIDTDDDSHTNYSLLYDNGKDIEHTTSLPDVLEITKEMLKDKIKEFPGRIVKKNLIDFAEDALIFTLVDAVVITFGLSLVIVCCINLKKYLFSRKTLFRIEYAGGCIAFNVSFYAKAEIDDFQKQLRRAKDMAEEGTSLKGILTETPVETVTQSSAADDLRKYAELLKEGLITQEEYDAMKKKVLGL